MRKYITCFLLIVSTHAYGCEVPPEEQYVPASELIARTNKIVLARAIQAELDNDDSSVKYTFRTEKVLKGTAAKEYTIVGAPPYQGAINDFNHHRDKNFWGKYGGRELNKTDCEISPAFGVGLTYLIFLNRPFHSKSFELIIRTHGSSSEKDKWLQFVEQSTAP